MAIDLLPPPQSPGLTVTNGEGGAYYVWTAAQFPLLSQANLGAGLLILHPHGFAIPHYEDSNKIGFVVDGIGKVGILLPNSTTEIVLAVKKGDTIAVPLGSVSWYYGGGPTSDLVIIFLGETSQSYTPGIFDYFFLAGTNGILGGFSNDIISKTYNFTSTEANSLTKSQTGTYIVKLRNGQNLPNPSNISSAKIVSYNLENAKPDLQVNNGGSLTTATAQNFPILDKIGLSAGLINLYNDSLLTPQFTVDSSNQLIYVTNGSGRVQIVGLNGQNVLDANAQKGQLFIVPKFFIAAKLAGEGGLKYINVVTSSKYV
ncbi:hypothetical protein ACH5RR_022528 [Cinchona calisaya]|uniref:Cupin type-1 domain-containing protein n=1 Tax=Cinchona calisaya TaxID=153742 RepID=A0ABD2Z821_9GENT